METLKQVLSHLEFLGYELEKIPSENNDELECCMAIHPTLNNLLIIDSYPHFITFLIKLTCNKPMSIDMLKYINNVTPSLLISNASCMEFENNQTILNFQATYIGEYSKELFGQFCNFLEEDQNRFRSSEGFNEIFID